MSQRPAPGSPPDPHSERAEAEFAHHVAQVAAPYEIQEDTPCLACGYNLRGLSSDWRCPECGTAIGRSLHGNLLRFAQPQYVRKLARGVTLILWGILVSILVAIAGFMWRVQAAPQVMANLMALLGGLVGLVGTWMVTAPDPGRLDEAWEFNARRLIRLTLLIGLGTHVVNALGAAFVRSSPASAGAGIPLSVLAFLLGVVSLVGQVAQFVYFRKLALRIPDDRLARDTRALMWGFVVFFGAAIVGGLLSGGLAAFRLTSLPLAILCLPVACFGGIGVLGCSIWWLVLLFKYRRRFVAQALLAEQTWHGDQGGATDQPVDIGGGQGS